MRLISCPSWRPLKISAFMLALATVAVCTVALVSGLLASAPAARAASAHVDVVPFDQEVDAASARFLNNSIQAARDDGAGAAHHRDGYTRRRSRRHESRSRRPSLPARYLSPSTYSQRVGGRPRQAPSSRSPRPSWRWRPAPASARPARSIRGQRPALDARHQGQE